MNRAVVVTLISVLITGCNHGLVRDGQVFAQSGRSECTKLEASDEVQLGLVRQMLEQDRAYAGLAHLAALSPAVQAAPQAHYLNAELLRQTGRAKEAEHHYHVLLEGCLAGYGHHGLGLLAAQNDMQQAVSDLREAAKLLPTDPRVRNDFGYALLVTQDSAGARREFMTAIQLGDYKQRAALNLLVLMLYEGDEQGAELLRRRLKLPDAELEQLRQQAVQLRTDRKNQSNGEG